MLIYHHVKYQNITHAKPATRRESPALAFIVDIRDWTTDINYSLISLWNHEMISMREVQSSQSNFVNIYITKNEILGSSP